MIIGLGTDIIEIPRIADMIDRHGELFLNRIYTDEEIRHCQMRRHSTQHFAGRWAAKEAVMKVLGTGFIKGIGWKDVAVTNLKSGRPIMTLSGGARRRADGIGIGEVLITISHCREYATATAVGVAAVGPPVIES
ncbi:MAG: holo-ACP synthase [Planctomycetaceae bacterium]